MAKILFVCLGNICRSPAAEGIARVLSPDRDWLFDSAGIGAWHTGEPPHVVMRRIAREHGFPIDDLRARQVRASDFQEFDWIVAMDTPVHNELGRLKERYAGRARCVLLLDELRHGTCDVPDPYYGTEADFRESFDLIRRGVEDFLNGLKAVAQSSGKH